MKEDSAKKPLEKCVHKILREECKHCAEQRVSLKQIEREFERMSRV